MRWRTVWLVGALAVLPHCAGAGSLLGDHTCVQWETMETPVKKSWVDSFLAPLSLTFKTLQKEKRDAYNMDLRASVNAVGFVDVYCAEHPEKVAADGAAEYFQMLMQR